MGGFDFGLLTITLYAEGLSETKLYQAFLINLNLTRTFLACLVARSELWLKVKFGIDFLK